MPLASMKTLLRHAREKGYAVGYFESWNLESLLAVKDAAERMSSPVIIGFNGGFLGRSTRKVKENVRIYGRLGRAVAEEARVPMAFILNEASDLEMLREGLTAGFNVVMHDNEGCSLEESIRINASLVRDAHAAGIEVEAEIGRLPTASPSGGMAGAGSKTDPEEAVRFAAETGVDALAVSAGNVHILEGRKVPLDLQLLKELAGRVPVPLVLHGGTGIDRADLRTAISVGVCKINVGTVLRRKFVTSLRRYYEENDVDLLDPGEITSTGGGKDMLAAARSDVAAEVELLMKLFGSEQQSETR
jgi:ketose-bisphosphate aldolase